MRVVGRSALPVWWLFPELEPLFEEKVFFELKNAQSVAMAFDGITPLPPTLCYLKPDFLPVSMTWFEQEQAGFDPGRVRS